MKIALTLVTVLFAVNLAAAQSTATASTAPQPQTHSSLNPDSADLVARQLDLGVVVSAKRIMPAKDTILIVNAGSEGSYVIPKAKMDKLLKYSSRIIKDQANRWYINSSRMKEYNGDTVVTKIYTGANFKYCESNDTMVMLAKLLVTTGIDLL